MSANVSCFIDDVSGRFRLRRCRGAFTSGSMAGGCSCRAAGVFNRVVALTSIKFYRKLSSPAKHQLTSFLWHRDMARGSRSLNLLVSAIILSRRREPFSLVVAYEASSSIFTPQRQFAHLRPDESETLGATAENGWSWCQINLRWTC